MNTLYACMAGVLIGGAAYLLLARDLIRLLLGLMLLVTGANVAVFVAGRVRHAVSPIIPEGLEAAPDLTASNPLPQAFVLTAIVIGFGTFAFLLALLSAMNGKLQRLDADQLPDADSDGQLPAKRTKESG